MVEEKPLVSAIIIFKNDEKFLQEAIESVFSQSYQDWELFLIDDGSTDNSTLIAQKTVEQFPSKVRYLAHPGRQNRGKWESRVLGACKATGEFIAYLDADDVWLPNKLEQQVGIFETQPEAAMLYGTTQYWFSWTGKPEDALRDYVTRLGVSPNKLIFPAESIHAFFIRQTYAIPSMSNIIVRHSAVEDLSRHRESFKESLFEDQAFYAMIFHNAPVLAVNACWDRYRQHADSSSAIAMRRGTEAQAREYFLNWLESFLSSEGDIDSQMKRAIKKEIFFNRHKNLQKNYRNFRRAVPDIKLLPFQIAYRILPAPVYHRLKALWRGEKYSPPPGWARFGDLRRLTPFSREFGYDRGLPVDRYYIENFLSDHKADIQGRVLEIADNTYTWQFGGGQVIKSEILHRLPGDPNATIIGDLCEPGDIPADSFDCVIITQTLQVIYDVRAAIRNIYRILKPGGVALITVPGIGPISLYDMEKWGYFWSFTSLSAQRLFEEYFAANHITVRVYGNVLTAASFIYGLATQELRKDELDFLDPAYEVIIAVRALKPSSPVHSLHTNK